MPYLVVGCPKCRLLQVYFWMAKSLKARKGCVRCGKTFNVDVSKHKRFETAQEAREALLYKQERLRRFPINPAKQRHKPCFGDYKPSFARECNGCFEETPCKQVSGLIAKRQDVASKHYELQRILKEQDGL